MSTIKNVAVIGTVGIPAKYGGFETLVEYITKELNTSFNFTIYCSAKQYKEKPNTYNNCNLIYINLEANGLQSIFYDIKSIFNAVKYADVLLILGVSGCICLPIVKSFYKTKILVNIDGLEWKRDKWHWSAKLFLKLSERIAVQFSHRTIADNEVIKNYVKDRYSKTANLVAYGGDHCKAAQLTLKTLQKFPFLKSAYAFKVCRIEPENNITIILQAFSNCPKNTLVLVGNWDNSTYGKNLRKTYSKYSNLKLLNPIYNQTQLNELRSNCNLYIHGHSAGGTNPSLVEAMSLKLPIIAFNINYNVETTKNKAIYFKTSQELESILKNICSFNLPELSNTMKKIANKHYTWKKIASEYKELLN